MTINELLAKYDELVEEVRKLPEMTEDQKKEQRACFAYGQLALTKEYREASDDKLRELRMLCREVAGCRQLRRDLPVRREAMKALHAALDRCPDQRIGQAIENAHFLSGSKASVFMIEDDDLLRGLELLGKK